MSTLFWLLFSPMSLSVLLSASSRRFSGLMSMWAMLAEWRWARAERSWTMYPHTVDSE